MILVDQEEIVALDYLNCNIIYIVCQAQNRHNICDIADAIWGGRVFHDRSCLEVFETTANYSFEKGTQSMQTG